MRIFHNVDKLEAFERMTLPHTGDLYRSAMCLLGDAAQAQIAVEDCFADAWRSARRLRDGGNCRAGLYKILFRILSQRRKGYPPAASIRHASDDLLTALRCMPEPLAQVVLLADVHEFTPQEIRDTLGISAASLTSLLRAGRQALAQFSNPSSETQEVDATPPLLAWNNGLEESRRLQSAQ